ncbi:serine/threonine protein kinase [Azovibrio restrictus]|uniref:methylation-associated defense system protein kinase MAD6 n=1 Tax=Azovibrio restrictus TaxID=146938 RepID=UPI0026F2DBD6|nr:serine/threonine protein kinase [Azovibrio restrictus]
MAKVIAFGQPVNESERQAIAHLRDHLPDTYAVIHNFEIAKGGEVFEIDLAVLAPHALYLVDVKGTRGVIDVYGGKWHPEGRTPYASPLAKLRYHAKTVKGIIVESQRGRHDLDRVYVDAAVVLTAPDAYLSDSSDRDAPATVKLEKSQAFFQDTSRIPGTFNKAIMPLHAMIVSALSGVVRQRSGPPRFGNWVVRERLGSTDAYAEYRACNTYVGERGGTALLRVYQADPYLPQAQRESQRRLIQNAYRALSNLPSHPNIAGARDFFATEEGDRFILVTEDIPGQALRVHLEKPQLALTLDQKVSVARELLAGLAHAHAHGVVHRNLTPSAVLIGADGHVRLTGFDFARVGMDSSQTIAASIVDVIDPGYVAPEAYRDPQHASAASDVFSAGLILYEMFAGERAFASPTEVFDRNGQFATPASRGHAELPPGFDTWLQGLCAFKAEDRPTAAAAGDALVALFAAKVAVPEEKPAPAPESAIDYTNLPTGHALTHKYLVERRLGLPGSFGVVYKVIDTLGDVARAVKLILHDRHSTLERLKKEYQTLLRIPEHRNVVRVFDADLAPGGIPFIVFEYVDGADVGEMIEQRLLAPEDVLDLARQVLDGLSAMHETGIWHCDIKPRNLLWTSRGAKIIDFNVSVRGGADGSRGGGSRRYLPPDFDPEAIAQPADFVDRDLYALGLTLYEALTGRYPWDAATPVPNVAAPDPRELSGFADLAPDFVQVVLRAIAPKRAERFISAREMQDALVNVVKARRLAVTPPAFVGALAGDVSGGTGSPNTNPFVTHLRTYFSQSRRSNKGTRGLDALSDKIYVETALDRELVKAVLSGEFKLVLISGNAGDGKTAFLQKLEHHAEALGATVDRGLPNGSRFELAGRRYLINYDGSQDEGDRENEEVLRQFFSPFSGESDTTWPVDETRLIAINEGRLIDFFSTHDAFPLLAKVAREGLMTGAPTAGVALVNLNLRSVVAEDSQGSILERLVWRMTAEELWAPCEGCDLKASCYALHNARTFQDEIAGPRVVERLKTLYAMTHLRGRLHVTMRDLRSALSFMLTSNRDCDEIHTLYRAGKRREIAQSFYFNSWMGGDALTGDRLLNLLAEVDVGKTEDPRFDRSLDFVSPDDQGLFRFSARADFDREVLGRLFDDLPRDGTGQPGKGRFKAHRQYLAMARRRYFFERRDQGWKAMLPYRTAERLVAIVRGEEDVRPLQERIVRAINRGEGLLRPERLAGSLALQIRQVEGGTLKSYRLFPQNALLLRVKDEASGARFVEHLPTGLSLQYQSREVSNAELFINLDIFEMLERLNEGYRPSVEEQQGYYLSLAVFKNVLNAMPYSEIMLTQTGHDFYRVSRREDGRLSMQRVEEVH